MLYLQINWKEYYIVLYFIYLQNIPQTKLNLRVILFQVCEGFTIQSSAYLPGAVQPMLETILMMENALCFRQFILPLGGLWLLKKFISILSQNLLLLLSGSNYIPWRMYWISVIFLMIALQLFENLPSSLWHFNFPG